MLVGGAAVGNALGPMGPGAVGRGGGGAGRPTAESTPGLHGSASPDEAASSSGDPGHEDHGGNGPSGSGSDGEHGAAMSDPTSASVSSAGYRLDVDATTLDGVAGTPLRFRIRDTEDAVVQGYRVRHERELHLFVAAHDLRTYHHLHPTRAVDGTWSVDLPPLPPGLYRAYTDFVVGDGTAVTLASDLLVPGSGEYATLPVVEPSAMVDGYTVELDGAPLAGQESEVVLRVLQDGAPVTYLEPYLGAAGHLVAIRAADLAFQHVHPVEAEPPPPSPPGVPPPPTAHEVRFAVSTPTPGDYRFFFDFAHGGGVHTAAFTANVDPAVGAGGAA